MGCQKIARSSRYLSIFLVLAFAMLFLGSQFDFAKTLAYESKRVLSISFTRAVLVRMPAMRSENFEIKFEEPDRAVARAILDTAETARRSVLDDMGAQTTGKALIVLHPSAERMNEWFGWSYQGGAMGAYSRGVIHLLNPVAWTATDDLAKQIELFIRKGPMIHELTHMVLDRQTRGNCPRWFSEGLAQYEEERIAGIEPVGHGLMVTPVRLRDLDRGFDSTTDEEIAYQRSYLMVRFLVDRYGPQAIEHIIAELGEGLSIEASLERCLETPVETIESNWVEWLASQQSIEEGAERSWKNSGEYTE